MLRSAYFTVTLRSPGSAVETALKLEARAPKIALAIRPGKPEEAVEAFMVLSRDVDWNLLGREFCWLQLVLLRSV
jgi:hypothetical protein